MQKHTNKSLSDHLGFYSNRILQEMKKLLKN